VASRCEHGTVPAELINAVNFLNYWEVIWRLKEKHASRNRVLYYTLVQRIKFLKLLYHRTAEYLQPQKGLFGYTYFIWNIVLCFCIVKETRWYTDFYLRQCHICSAISFAASSVYVIYKHPGQIIHFKSTCNPLNTYDHSYLLLRELLSIFSSPQ